MIKTKTIGPAKPSANVNGATKTKGGQKAVVGQPASKRLSQQSHSCFLHSWLVIASGYFFFEQRAQRRVLRIICRGTFVGSPGCLRAVVVVG